MTMDPESRREREQRTESASLANSGSREVWWLASGTILSCVPIGRGAAPGKLNFLSFSSSFFSSEEEMGMAYDGPTGAIVGALGAVVAYRLSAGSQCGFFWAWLRRTMATRWREGFATFGFGGGGWVRMWWYAPRSEGWIWGMGS